jgi:hypothetical protein
MVYPLCPTASPAITAERGYTVAGRLHNSDQQRTNACTFQQTLIREIRSTRKVTSLLLPRCPDVRRDQWRLQEDGQRQYSGDDRCAALTVC